MLSQVLYVVEPECSDEACQRAAVGHDICHQPSVDGGTTWTRYEIVRLLIESRYDADFIMDS